MNEIELRKVQRTKKLIIHYMTPLLRKGPQKWITSKSKLSFEGKTLRLYTSDSTFKERTTKVDHFKVKAQL
jgi:hypothetical protein